jgi:hypothetical protein
MRDALFIWIPKNAGCSIEWSLGLRRYPEKNDARMFKGRGQVTFCHQPIDLLISQKLVKKEFVDNAFKFTVIRNPYDRALSLYEYSRDPRIAVIPEHTAFVDVLKKVKRKIPAPGLYRSRGLSQWNPQVRFMGDVQFDFILRFERLKGDFAKLCDILQMCPRDLAHKNASRGDHDYRKEYTQEARSLVEEIYAADLMQFDYTF